MTHIWRHPKYYAELRAARKKLQAEESSSIKRQATSTEGYKRQAPSDSKKDSKSSSAKQQAS